MPKIVTIGEALIDFMPEQKGVGLKDVVSFQKAPGGAPANVAVAVARLGGQSAFIGKLGQDAFGDFLIQVLNEVGVGTAYIKRTDKANTALAFVSLRSDGERDFSFYRSPSADMLLDESEIDSTWFDQGDILHFCSVSLVDAPVKKAHIAAISAAKAAGCMICFDPNVRLPLWKDHEQYQRVIKDFIPYADLLKISEDELEFITGMKDEKEAIQWLVDQGAQLLIVTRGGTGASAYSRGTEINVEGYKVQVMDTTGAGDSFIGSFLYQIVRDGIDLTDVSKEQIREMLRFSNATAALTTSKKGAINALPSLEEVRACMGE